MESSTSKVEVIIKPMLLKAGIPLALYVAGFICAKLMAKRSLNPKEISEADDQVLRDGDSSYSFSSTHVCFPWKIMNPLSWMPMS
ncbi:unnamed protein product [Prunus armeniaca]